MENRERKVDVEQLTADQADNLSVLLGEKVKEINDKAVSEVNRILNIYGLEAKMLIKIGKIGGFEPKKTRKQEKKKRTNL